MSKARLTMSGLPSQLMPPSTRYQKQLLAYCRKCSVWFIHPSGRANFIQYGPLGTIMSLIVFCSHRWTDHYHTFSNTLIPLKRRTVPCSCRFPRTPEWNSMVTCLCLGWCVFLTGDLMLDVHASECRVMDAFPWCWVPRQKPMPGSMRGLFPSVKVELMYVSVRKVD